MKTISLLLVILNLAACSVQTAEPRNDASAAVIESAPPCAPVKPRMPRDDKECARMGLQCGAYATSPDSSIWCGQCEDIPGAECGSLYAGQCTVCTQSEKTPATDLACGQGGRVWTECGYPPDSACVAIAGNPGEWCCY